MTSTFVPSRAAAWIAALLVFGASMTARADLFGGGGNDANEEYIILSGGPANLDWENYRAENQRHDRWWGNFVRAARIRMQQLRAERGPNLNITWLVYRAGYEKRGLQDKVDHIANIVSVKDRPDVRCNLVWYNSSEDIFNYLNNGPAGRPRAGFKINGFEYFGHSNKYCFTLDYSGEVLGASKVFIHVDDLTRLNRGIFARDAKCQSWGCHSGEAMSKSWRAATGVKMKGAIGKTDYSECWKGTLPHISTPGGRWTS